MVARNETDVSRIMLWILGLVLALVLAFVVYKFIGTFVVGLFIYYISKPVYSRLNQNVKSANFNIDTINQKTYVFGIAYSENEKKEIIQEAKQIVDLKEIVTSILMVSDLSRQKE